MTPPSPPDLPGDYSDYAKPLLDFTQAHPQSAWNVALLTNLGLGFAHDGYISRALPLLQQAWEQGRTATTAPAQRLVDRAVGELALLQATLGHEPELTALLADVGKRPIGGPATERFQSARETLWKFHHSPETAYLCGPAALLNILSSEKAAGKPVTDAQLKLVTAALSPVPASKSDKASATGKKRQENTKNAIATRSSAPSAAHGYSLPRLSALADKAGLKHELIYRKPGQPIPVPSIVHWGTHHYAAIISVRGGIYDVRDPVFGVPSTGLTAKAIDAEASGYFLVPSEAALKTSANGWRVVQPGAAEIKAVYGAGQSNGSIPGATLSTDIRMSDCLSCLTPTNIGFAVPGVDGAVKIQQTHPPQMTVADAQAMTVGLNLKDTPVGYQPQKGLSALTTVSYNARDGMQPANFSFSNLSPKWSHSWMSYISDDPRTGHEGQTVVRIAGGGGGYNYSSTSYSTSTGKFSIGETPDNSLLSRTPATGTATSYTRTMPDGSKETYSLSNGAATPPRLMFLTSITDPQGNTTSLNYDGTFRITSMQDAMGRSTTFTYGLSGSPLLITQITDPFSRAAQMTYDATGRLNSITDPIGITSTFTYSTAEPNFVWTLTTPYGTSKFSDRINPYDLGETNTRSLTLTDPLGYTDFLYFYDNPNITPAYDADGVPTGLINDNGYLNGRNTYYLDRHATLLGVTLDACFNPLVEDYTKARLYHWNLDLLMGSNNYVGRALASYKNPLDYRVWTDYAGQTGINYNGTLDHPLHVARLLSSTPTQQLTHVTYNGATTYPATITDAKGRVTQYTYATNNIDLLTVAQETNTTGPVYTTVATYGSYNTQHEPQTYTGPDGQTWNYTYTAAGQIATVKDPNLNTTTYNYDTSNRLSTVVNANTQTVLTLTYDSADRIATRKDSEGYILTYSYDNLDRVTKITYPDATTDLYDYTFQSGPLLGTPSLDLRKYTDRLGRVTTYAYDADRNLTGVTEALTSGGTRTTNYHYYENGTLKDITDANGNVTHWDIDVESRPTDKVYAYGTAGAKTETFAYENKNGRLHSVTDALGQVKTYAYDVDDELTSITYTSAVNPTPTVTFTYDQYFPRLSTMADGTGTTTYSYTAIGSNGALKLSSIAGPYTNDTLGLTYDVMGRLSGETITGGNEGFTYDAINRLSTHTTPLGTFSYTYNGQTGQTAGRTVTNGTTTVSTSWGYDTNTNDRRLISITNSGVTRSYTLGYGSGPVNPYDVMSITDTAATGHPWATQSRAYTYDYADRLLTASSTTPGNDTYAYDALDNPTTWTITGTTTNPTFNGFNQVATWGALSYTYDANGNLTSGDGRRPTSGTPKTA